MASDATVRVPNFVERLNSLVGSSKIPAADGTRIDKVQLWTRVAAVLKSEPESVINYMGQNIARYKKNPEHRFNLKYIEAINDIFGGIRIQATSVEEFQRSIADRSVVDDALLRTIRTKARPVSDEKIIPISASVLNFSATPEYDPTAVRVFAVNTKLKCEFVAFRDGYLTAFTEGPNGRVWWVYPSTLGWTDCPFVTGGWMQIGSDNQPVYITGPTGLWRLHLLLSAEPLMPDGLRPDIGPGQKPAELLTSDTARLADRIKRLEYRWDVRTLTYISYYADVPG